MSIFWKISLTIIVLALLGFNFIVWFILPKIEFPNPPERATDELDFWIAKLAEKENCGEFIIDSNEKKSYGDLCFQETTFREFGRRFGMFQEAEDREVLNFILDRKIQFKIARKMILINYENWRHWYNSVVRVCENEFQFCGVGRPPILNKNYAKKVK